MKYVPIIYLYTLMIVGCSHEVSKRQALPISQLADESLKIMRTCPNRLWPSYNWEKMDIVLIDKGGEQITVSTKKQTVSRNSLANLPKSVYQSLFGFFEHNGL